MAPTILRCLRSLAFKNAELTPYRCSVSSGEDIEKVFGNLRVEHKIVEADSVEFFHKNLFQLLGHLKGLIVQNCSYIGDESWEKPLRGESHANVDCLSS